MMPPRATLMSRAPLRIRLSSAAPITPRVASVSGTWTVRKSVSVRSVSKSQSSTPTAERALGGDERVVREHAHAQALAGDARHLGSDLAEPEHAERLLAQLDAHELRALPETGVQRAVGRREVARQREHHRDDVLGRGDGVAGGRVEDEHAVPRRRLDVDVVDADTGASDHAELGRRGEHLGGDLGLAAHHERVVVADALAQRARRRARSRRQPRRRRAGVSTPSSAIGSATRMRVTVPVAVRGSAAMLTRR